VAGYLSLFILMINGIRKWFIRRRIVAIGPVKDVREALVKTRTRLNDIKADPRRSPWFLKEERNETDAAISDLVGQVHDAKLSRYLREVADAWKGAFASAPPPRGGDYGVTVPGPVDPIALRQAAEASEDAECFQRQADAVKFGLKSLGLALARLDALEKKTRGR
jgi:hypothetical protein